MVSTIPRSATEAEISQAWSLIKRGKAYAAAGDPKMQRIINALADMGVQSVESAIYKAAERERMARETAAAAEQLRIQQEQAARQAEQLRIQQEQAAKLQAEAEKKTFFGVDVKALTAPVIEKAKEIGEVAIKKIEETGQSAVGFFIPSIKEKEEQVQREEQVLIQEQAIVTKGIEEFEEKYAGKELPQEQFDIATIEKTSLEKQIAAVESRGASIIQKEEFAKTELERKQFEDPTLLVSGFVKGAVESPFVLGSLAVGLAIKPVTTVKETILGFKELPKQIAKTPISTLSELGGSLTGQAVILGGIFGTPKTKITPSEFTLIKPAKITKTPLSTTFTEKPIVVTKIIEEPKGIFFEIEKPLVKRYDTLELVKPKVKPVEVKPITYEVMKEPVKRYDVIKPKDYVKPKAEVKPITYEVMKEPVKRYDVMEVPKSQKQIQILKKPKQIKKVKTVTQIFDIVIEKPKIKLKTKIKEKPIQTSAQVFKTELKQITKLVQVKLPKQKVIGIPLLKQVQKQVQLQLQLPKQVQVQKQEQVQLQLPKQVQVQKQGQLLKEVFAQPQAQALIEFLKQPQKEKILIRQVTIPKTKIIPKLIDETGGFKKLLKGKPLVDRKGYYAEVKESGKWKRIMKEALRRNQAEALSKLVTDKTIGASARIVQSGKKPTKKQIISSFTLGNKFRDFKISKGKKVPLKDRWIEKRAFRLDTPSEVQTLKSFKKTAGFKNLFPKSSFGATPKRKKSKKGGWFQ